MSTLKIEVERDGRFLEVEVEWRLDGPASCGSIEILDAWVGGDRIELTAEEQLKVDRLAWEEIREEAEEARWRSRED